MPVDAKYTHGGFAGPSIIDKIQSQADEAFRRYMRMERAPRDDSTAALLEAADAAGKAEGEVLGLAKSLAKLRSTDVGVEYENIINRYQNKITTGRYTTFLVNCVDCDKSLDDFEVCQFAEGQGGNIDIIKPLCASCYSDRVTARTERFEAIEKANSDPVAIALKELEAAEKAVNDDPNEKNIKRLEKAIERVSVLSGE